MSIPAIQLKNVSYHYSKAQPGPINDVSLRIERGESIGLLGHNGSGKSTLLRIIATLLEPNSGELLYEGEPARKQLNKIRAVTNFSAGAPLGFYPRLTGEENLVVFSAYKGSMISSEEVNQILDRVGLVKEVRRTKYFQYSLGMRQRLHLARLLLKPCEFVLIDEPTNGLDPAGQSLLTDILNNDLQRTTRVLISHDARFLSETTSRRFLVEGGGLHASKD